MKLSNLIKMFLVSMTLTASLQSWAQESAGPGGTGGGNFVKGGKLLDLWENEGTKKFDVEASAAFQQVIKPLFANIDSKIPAFSKLLLEGVKGKIWYLEPKHLTHEGCIDKSIFEVQKQIAACQDKREVRLSEKAMASADLQNQAGLIVHELIRFQIRNNWTLSDSDISFTTRTIFDAYNMTADQLQQQLAQVSPIFNFSTASERAQGKAWIRSQVKPMCYTGVTNQTATKVMAKLTTGALEKYSGLNEKVVLAIYEMTGEVFDRYVVPYTYGNNTPQEVANVCAIVNKLAP
jgi:hypothetical protein